MLHQFGVSFDLYCDARKHKIKKKLKYKLIYIYIYPYMEGDLRIGNTISSICIIQPTTRSLWKFKNMHLYYDHTPYSFPLYKVLWPEDDPQLPKHVVVSIINRIQRQLCFDVPHPLPLLIAKNTTAMMRLKMALNIPRHPIILRSCLKYWSLIIHPLPTQYTRDLVPPSNNPAPHPPYKIRIPNVTAYVFFVNSSTWRWP